MLGTTLPDLKGALCGGFCDSRVAATTTGTCQDWPFYALSRLVHRRPVCGHRADDDKPDEASGASLRGTGVATVVGKVSDLCSFNTVAVCALVQFPNSFSAIQKNYLLVAAAVTQNAEGCPYTLTCPRGRSMMIAASSLVRVEGVMAAGSSALLQTAMKEDDFYFVLPKYTVNADDFPGETLCIPSTRARCASGSGSHLFCCLMRPVRHRGCATRRSRRRRRRRLRWHVMLGKNGDGSRGRLAESGRAAGSLVGTRV